MEVLDGSASGGCAGSATVAHDGADYATVDLTGPVALVLGNEAHGLPDRRRRARRRPGDHPDGGPHGVAERRDGRRRAVLRSGPAAHGRRDDAADASTSCPTPSWARRRPAHPRRQRRRRRAHRATASTSSSARPSPTLLEPRGRDGKPLLADGWHPSARLPSVRRMPEQEVTLRRRRRRRRARLVTGAYQRDGDGGADGRGPGRCATSATRPTRRRPASRSSRP